MAIRFRRVFHEHRISITGKDMKRISVVIAATCVLASGAFGQGKSGRNPSSGGSPVPAQAQQRLDAQINQRAQQQIQKSVTDGAARAAENASRAADGAARSAQARAAATAGQRAVDTASRDAVPSGRSSANDASRRMNENQGKQPDRDNLNGAQHANSQAIEHANIHSVIASGLATGKNMKFNAEQRQQLTEVFGDASLLGPQAEERAAMADANVRSQRGQTPNASASKGQNVLGAGRSIQPDSRSNPNARLGNAIRVRRAQISQLRDQAINSGDTKLLERADTMERTLDRFLQTQSQIDARFAEATGRRDLERPQTSGFNGLRPSDDAPRTATLSSDGLIE